MQAQTSHPLVLYDQGEADSPPSFVPRPKLFGAMASGSQGVGAGMGSVPQQLVSPADLIEIMSRTSPREKLPHRRPGSRGSSVAADRGRKKHLEEEFRFGENADERRPRRERPRSVGGPQYDQPISQPSRREHRRHAMKQRSQSLGGQSRKVPSDVSGSLRPIVPVPLLPPQTLNLYHVSRPEPRARWVFNLSKHTNVVEKGPPPDIVTSTIDAKRPNLGGLVWVNATLGGHCCLQKGTRSKTVTPVPADVLDGWLNGQTGIWWIGALKEGHRALWDSHVVKSWAMVFIPSSPEVAARNNMEVYKDKCLKGSLRVARPGELARKIIDIVSDDQDAEPEAVVHTHLCILLAEGDDLELKRHRMFPSTPRLTPKSLEGGERVMRHSKSLGNLSSGTGAGNPVDLSQVTLDDNGVPKLLPNSSGEENPGQDDRRGNAQTVAELQEALHRVEQYRSRILILKEDRQAKKAVVAQLKDELREKEEMFAAENERLRQERNEIKERAKMLWIDLENLRSSHAEVTAGCLTLEQADSLRAQVDRLRRERNDARSDAMRWLEQQQQMQLQSQPQPPQLQQQSSMRLPAPSPATVTPGSQEDFRSGGGQPSGATAAAGGPGAASANEVKAAAAIQKLKAKVERLRKERDGAEKQAAAWLQSEKEKLRQEFANASTTSSALPMAGTPATAPVSSSPEKVAAVSSDGDGRSFGDGKTRHRNVTSKSFSAEGGDSGGGGGGVGPRKNSGPVVASLKAESSRLKRELDESKKEAKRWKDRATANGSSGGGGMSGGFSRGVSSGGSTNTSSPAVNEYRDGDDEVSSDQEESGAQARRALGQLLGQALHLLDPKGAEAGAGSSSAEAEAVVGNPQDGNGAANMSSNGTPMAELVEISATLVGGE